MSLKHFQLSHNSVTVAECQNKIGQSIESSISESSIKKLTALSCLLDELSIHKILPFDVSYEEYAAKVPSIANSTNQKSARVQFRNLILSKKGIPVVIVHNQGKRYLQILLYFTFINIINVFPNCI